MKQKKQKALGNGEILLWIVMNGFMLAFVFVDAYTKYISTLNQ